MVNVNKLRFGKEGVETLLSPLESEVLEMLWEKESVTVREIFNALKGKRKVALTSIAVILNRLHTKKIVKRSAVSGRGGYHYIYSPATSKSDFESSVVENTVNKLISTFGDSAVNYFNERFKKGGKK